MHGGPDLVGTNPNKIRYIKLIVVDLPEILYYFVA